MANAALHRDPGIAAGAQPGQVRLCRQARVHDHRRERAGPPLRFQPLDRGLQGAGLGDIALEHLAAAWEARPVQGQRQGRQRTVAALLLGAAELHVTGRPAVIVHVGQVVEDDRLGRVEEAPLALSEGRLERLAVLPEQVGGAVQLTQRQRLGPFQAEQLAADGADPRGSRESTCTAKPDPRLSSVRWLTCEPERTDPTSRNEV